ncbi:phosphatase PAP2 family protein [Virgibacillus sp. FSP13]
MSNKKRRYFYLFLIVLLLFTSLLWIVKIKNGVVPYVDQWTRDFVEGLDKTNLYFLFRWLTELGSGSFLMPFTIFAGALLWWIYRNWFVCFMFVGGILLSYMINIGIKIIVARERPRIFAAAEAEGYSFPSGHAMISMVCYGLLIYFMTQKLKTAKAVIVLQISGTILIFAIGISRYMIRVHYLTDVLAGFVFGFAFLVLWIKVYEYVRKFRLQIYPT